MIEPAAYHNSYPCHAIKVAREHLPRRRPYVRFIHQPNAWFGARHIRAGFNAGSAGWRILNPEENPRSSFPSPHVSPVLRCGIYSNRHAGIGTAVLWPVRLRLARLRSTRHELSQRTSPALSPLRLCRSQAQPTSETLGYTPRHLWLDSAALPRMPVSLLCPCWRSLIRSAIPFAG